MNLFGLSGIFAGVSLLSLTVIVLIHDHKSRLNQIFALFMLSGGLWGLGAYQVSRAVSPEDALLWWRLVQIPVIFIPITYLHFVYVFLGLAKKRAVYISYLAALGFLVADATPYFVVNVRKFFDMYYHGGGSLSYTLFVAFFAGLVVYAQYLLFVCYRKSSGEKRKIIFYVFLAGLIGYPAGTTAFLPVFGIDVYPALGTLLISLYAATIFYTITRYRLFNARIIVAEALTIATWMLFLMRIFFMAPAGIQAIDIVILFTAITLGIFAIRSALKEARQREQLEGLTLHLQEKVDEQTHEIKRAYEVEKKARVELEELDKAKDQFILTTQHHLRTPLTIIKGYLAILEGDTTISQEGQSVVKKVSSSADTLSKFINDLLQITEVEVNKQDKTTQE